MSDNESETTCDNCPACAAKRKTVDRIENTLCQIDMKKNKLYSAYKSNLAHIQAQMEKIKTAERIKKRFELALEGNKEDMEALKKKCIETYKEIDDDDIFEYLESRKIERMANLTLPPPPRSSGAHTPEDEEPSTSS